MISFLIPPAPEETITSQVSLTERIKGIKRIQNYEREKREREREREKKKRKEKKLRENFFLARVLLRWYAIREEKSRESYRKGEIQKIRKKASFIAFIWQTFCIGV